MTGYALVSTSRLRKYIGPLDALFSGLDDRVCFLSWAQCMQAQVRFGTLTLVRVQRHFLPVFKTSRVKFGPFFSGLQRAMAEHRTQRRWYRRLYLVFSRYMFMNTLAPLFEGT